MESLSSFGDLLKTFRQRQCLTQQVLAEMMGVHRNTIGIWERGNYLPESKTTVLELAYQLGLAEQETRQLLEASLTALPPHWSVPLSRNLYFTGREQVLETLHTQLSIERALALTQSSALHGLGGVGKTQIALEYAYRYGLEYSAVFWLGVETQEELLAGLVRVASVLQLPEREDKDQQRVAEAVQRWLATSGQWLLILDNLEELDVLDRFLPAVRQGAVLLTTRLQTLGTRARGLDLWPMGQEEGTLFLLLRAKVLSPEAATEEMQELAGQIPEQHAAAVELVDLLGGLPLALDQAGAYLEATRCGLPAYLERFRTQQTALLKLRGEGVREHPASVSTTFRLAFTAITRCHPAVGDLLRVCALVQPDAIPEELFFQGAEHLGPQLQVSCRDPLEWDRLVGVACSYSLLSRQPEERTLSMHRLVQVVLLDGISKAEQEQWSRHIIEALNAVFPNVSTVTEYALREQWNRLLPHALHCLRQAESCEGSLAFASLAYKTAYVLHARARYAEAEALHLQALQIREQLLGPVHPDVASSLAYLAFLYREQGNYAQAEALYLRALQIREQVRGPVHPEVASTLNNLAIVYWMQGRHAEAESFYLRALHTWEQLLGPDHPDLFGTLNNLAELYGDQGKYAQAEPLYLRALHLGEQALGPTHPDVAAVLSNLASLYREQGKYAQAEPLLLQALRTWEQARGPDHPDVAFPLNNLAELYSDQGRYAEAEPLCLRSLRIWEQAHGPDHPMGALWLTTLANLYAEQGKYTEAEPLYVKALRLREHALEVGHPQLAESLNGLARLYLKQDRESEAEPLLQRALAIREEKLGAQHADTAQTLHDLTLLRQKQSKVSEALSLAQRALSICSQALGEAHLKTVATRTLYDQLLRQQMDTREETTSVLHPEAVADLHREDPYAHGVSRPLQEVGDLPPSANDPFQEFLDACCELHPLAWCPIRELWHSYEQWTAASQGCLPLPRRLFAAQLQARGCRVARTSTVRIWRGIRLVKKHP